jgi:hypothetical protein
MLYSTGALGAVEYHVPFGSGGETSTGKPPKYTISTRARSFNFDYVPGWSVDYGVIVKSPAAVIQ